MIRVALVLMGVLIGCHAFGHHALQRVLTPAKLDIYDTALRYAVWGVLWMLIASVAKYHYQWSRAYMILIGGGLVVFCGSLMLYLLTSYPLFMMTTPIGGIGMIIGFIGVGFSIKPS